MPWDSVPTCGVGRKGKVVVAAVAGLCAIDQPLELVGLHLNMAQEELCEMGVGKFVKYDEVSEYAASVEDVVIALPSLINIGISFSEYALIDSIQGSGRAWGKIVPLPHIIDDHRCPGSGYSPARTCQGAGVGGLGTPLCSSRAAHSP